MFAIREKALVTLEQARQAKTIGKALEAHITISAPKAAVSTLQVHVEAFRELLNVSQLSLTASATPDDAGATAPSFTVAHADGQKCERCWHWETDIGSIP